MNSKSTSEHTQSSLARPLRTVIDRLVQQAIAQMLMEELEPKFLPNSYAYRPRRSADDAILEVKENADKGFEWVVALDLSKFLDAVNHGKMMQVLSDTIKDGRVILLIHRFFRAKIYEDGKYTRLTCGMPQGGPLSPVCANILL